MAANCRQIGEGERFAKHPTSECRISWISRCSSWFEHSAGSELPPGMEPVSKLGLVLPPAPGLGSPASCAVERRCTFASTVRRAPLLPAACRTLRGRERPTYDDKFVGNREGNTSIVRECKSHGVHYLRQTRFGLEIRYRETG